jgi:hypothetical protein
MTMFDAKAEMMLELAQLAPEPSAAAQARNLAALRVRLALPLPPTANAPAPIASPQAELAALPRGGSLVPASLRKLGAVGIITGAIGFFVGLSVNRAVLLEPSQSAAPLTALATPGPATPRSATPAPAAPAPTALAPRAPATPPLDQAALPVPVPSPRAGALAGQRRDKVRASSARSDGASASGFFEAVQLLRRARNALQKGEAALALGLLDEMDARFPREVLDEERGATRVLGLCASGASEAARQLTARLNVRYPRSIYAHRLEQSCAGSAVRSSE